MGPSGGFLRPVSFEPAGAAWPVVLHVPADEPVERPLLQGELLWGSGLVLAAHLPGLGLVEGRRVLELGSGLGLGGLAAAALGAAEVVLTDRPGPVLDALRRNVRSNAAASARFAAASAEALDWSAGVCSATDADTCSSGAFDVALGADVLYDAAAPAALLRALRRRLRRGGVFACVDPGRDGGARALLRAEMERLGDEWHYSETAIRDPVALTSTLGCSVIPLPPRQRRRVANALGAHPEHLDATTAPGGVLVRHAVAADAP